MALTVSESDPTIEDMRRVIREELRPLWTRIERHDREIYGHNGTPGLTTRVTSNENHAKRVAWAAATAWVVILGGIATAVAKMFGK